MTTLHLIIHKEAIEEELRSGLFPAEKRPRLESVIRRIREIEYSEKDLAHLHYVLRDEAPRPVTEEALEASKGYTKIILYGISTQCCVLWVRQALEVKGIKADYDTEGVID